MRLDYIYHPEGFPPQARRRWKKLPYRPKRQHLPAMYCLWCGCPIACSRDKRDFVPDDLICGRCKKRGITYADVVKKERNILQLRALESEQFISQETATEPPLPMLNRIDKGIEKKEIQKQTKIEDRERKESEGILEKHKKPEQDSTKSREIVPAIPTKKLIEAKPEKGLEPRFIKKKKTELSFFDELRKNFLRILRLLR